MGTAWMGVSDACVMEWVAMRFRDSFLNLSKGTNTICRISSHFGHHSPREMLDLTMRTPGQAQWRARVLSGVKSKTPEDESCLLTSWGQAPPLRPERGVRLGGNFLRIDPMICLHLVPTEWGPLYTCRKSHSTVWAELISKENRPFSFHQISGESTL